MVQIDHMSVQVEGDFSVKEFKAVCPVSKLGFMRTCSRATAASRYEYYPFDCGDLNGGAPNLELQRDQPQSNHDRSHQSLKQMIPMEY